MKRIRFISLLVVALLVFSAFGTGCRQDKEKTEEPTYLDYKTGKYFVIAPEGSEYKTTYCKTIQTEMRKWEGMEVYSGDDVVTREEPEIMIGNCNRPAVTEALAALYNIGGGYASDFIIYVTGGNIVLIGNSDSATEQAVEYYINNMLSEGRIQNGVAYYQLGTRDGFSNITINNEKFDGRYYIITPERNMSYIVRLQIEELTKALIAKTGFNPREMTDTQTPEFTYETLNLYRLNTWDNCESDEDFQNYRNHFESLDKTKAVTDYTYEIVIGNCDRAGCPSITDKDQYTITVSGKRVFLNGGSPSATAMAVSEFTKMVNSGNLTLTDVSTVVGSYSQTVAGYNRDNYYTLAWGDDFEGNSIDTDKWQVSYGRDGTIYASGLNHRIPARASKTLNNNYVQDGKLYICAAYDKNHYYGGHLQTKDTMTFQYGYVEYSCMKPFGQGFWTTLWVDNQHLDRGLGRMEIDVNESFGSTHMVLQNSITWVNTKGIRNTITNYDIRLPYGTHFDKSDPYYVTDTRGFHMDFHTFGFGWDENELYFTIDGKRTQHYDYATTAMINGNNITTQNYPGATIEQVRNMELDLTKSAFSTPAYLRLSMAVGFDVKDFIVKDDDRAWTETNKYIIDYVHVYQLEGQKMYLH